MTDGLRLLLVGATGAVGQAVLAQALDSRVIRRIVAPTRRPLSRRERPSWRTRDLSLAAVTGEEFVGPAMR